MLYNIKILCTTLQYCVHIHVYIYIHKSKICLYNYIYIHTHKYNMCLFIYVHTYTKLYTYIKRYKYNIDAYATTALYFLKYVCVYIYNCIQIILYLDISIYLSTCTCHLEPSLSPTGGNSAQQGQGG